MRVLFLVLVVTSCLCAQERPRGDGREARDPNANVSQPQDYAGCITRSGGDIVFTDGSGKQYKLMSRSSRNLASYVGQQVQIRAADINPADPSSGERSVASGQERNGREALDGGSIEIIADCCAT